MSYSKAAKAAGRRSNDAVSYLVCCFNQCGLAALHLRHGGGNPIQYGIEEQQKILNRLKTPPGSKAGWHCHVVSEHPSTGSQEERSIGSQHLYDLETPAREWVFLAAQQNLGDTCKAIRMRKRGLVELQDGDRIAKKNSSKRPIRRLATWA